jgi:hypothetical protein
MRRGREVSAFQVDKSGYKNRYRVTVRAFSEDHPRRTETGFEMKTGTRNRWASPRHWVSGWAALPVFLLFAATAQAGDLPDGGIGPPAATVASPRGAVSTSTAGAERTLVGANLGPAESIGGTASTPPEQAADPGPQTAPIADVAPPPASALGAEPGTDAGDGTTPSLEGSGVATAVSGARKRATSPVKETVAPALKELRATTVAVIDSMRAQLVDLIRRIDPPSRPSAQEQPVPGAIRRWTVPEKGARSPASANELGRLGLNPSGRGSVTVAPEASSTHQPPSHHLAIGAKRPDSGAPASSSVNTGTAAGLGSAASLLISVGLAAAACGFAAPACRRRLFFRAGRLKPALVASLLEQPG